MSHNKNEQSLGPRHDYDSLGHLLGNENSGSKEDQEPTSYQPYDEAVSAERDLDPTDWDQFRVSAHSALEDMITFLESIRTRPVWQQAPPQVLARFRDRLPRDPRDFQAVLEDFGTNIKPFGAGSLHPLFMGWVNGAGTPVGMVAEMLSAGLNINCGGRNHIGLQVEDQITSWAAETFGLPPESSGIFVTGTSTANLVAVLVARDSTVGHQVRRKGLLGSPQLTAYSSAEAHGSIINAFDKAGIGSENLRRIPVDEQNRMRLDQLSAAVAEDRALGNRPFMVLGTAGSVNSGAIDDLDAIASFCQNEHLWFHIDGAFGALAALSDHLRPLVRGLERADSIAFDFHKWAHVPYDAGFFITRHPEEHRGTFASSVAYLTRAPRGIAAGETWPCDLGPDLSRSFRALKTWFTLQVHGTKQIAACIERCCDVAKALEARIQKSDLFELVAPVPLNIVCFSLRGDASGTKNRQIVMDLHERGLAAPSITTLSGRAVIRAAIVNHRTRESDMDAFLGALSESAAQ